MMKLVIEDFNGNGELGGVRFLVEVRPTTKGFSKSFSMNNSKKSLSQVLKILHHFIM